MAPNKETKVGQVMDSVTTYAIAIVSLLFAAVLTYASTIMTIGGVVLLLLRLYVDGMKAYKTYKEHKDDYKRGQ